MPESRFCNKVLLKKGLWQRCFPVNFAKFLRTTFLTEHLHRLLLDTATHIFINFRKYLQKLLRETTQDSHNG